MGVFNYISLLPALRASPPTGAADMSLEQTQGTLIKGLVLVLNSLLLERPAFISLAQQTTDTHRRLRVRTRLHSYTQIACGVCACVFVCFGPELQMLLRKMGVAVIACFVFFGTFRIRRDPTGGQHLTVMWLCRGLCLNGRLPCWAPALPHWLSGRETPRFSH